MSGIVAVDDKQALFIIVQVEAIEHSGIVGGNEGLLVIVGGQFRQVFDEGTANAGIQSGFNVINGKQRGCFLADEQGQVEQDVQCSFVGIFSGEQVVVPPHEFI